MIKQNRKTELVGIIKKNPGLNFRAIMRFTGMKNGVLSHHLSKLENEGTIKVKRGPRQTRYFSLYITEQESNVIKALRRQTPRDILISLIIKDDLQFNEIVKHVKKSPSTVSLYLSQLVEDNVVEIQLINRKKTYHVKDKNIIDKLIEDYRPNILEKPTAGLEEIFNSL